MAAPDRPGRLFSGGVMGHAPAPMLAQLELRLSTARSRIADAARQCPAALVVFDLLESGLLGITPSQL